MNRTLAVKALMALALAAAAAGCISSPARAQLGSSPEEQSFDYNPDAAKEMPQIQQSIAETTFEDAEIINHPVYGTIVLSKSRWKNWVARAMYLALINIALIAIILSLGRNSEYNLIISYILCGASFTVSFWVFLCAALIFLLKATGWIYILPVSMVMGAAGYIVLMKVKRSDVSFTELKDSFQKMRAAAIEDSRLVSVEGSPGDWPEEDFIKLP